jgi:hypothetical protein
MTMEELMRTHRFGSKWWSTTDDFEGEVVGWYITREEKPGVVLQMIDKRVVHVYATKWLQPMGGNR